VFCLRCVLPTAVLPPPALYTSPTCGPPPAVYGSLIAPVPHKKLILVSHQSRRCRTKQQDIHKNAYKTRSNSFNSRYGTNQTNPITVLAICEAQRFVWPSDECGPTSLAQRFVYLMQPSFPMRTTHDACHPLRQPPPPRRRRTHELHSRELLPHDLNQLYHFRTLPVYALTNRLWPKPLAPPCLSSRRVGAHPYAP
jgi:hypothetical protein